MPAIQIIDDADGDPFHIEELPGRVLREATEVEPYCEIVARHPSGCILLNRGSAAALHGWIGQWLAEQGQEGGDDADAS